jgi:predicted NBD/HSP70 family sugar kinase
MRRTGDQFMVKEINTSIVLDTIIRYHSISRARISELTGLNKGTVSSLVQELIHHHLVFETGSGESSGGRKPVMLQFKDDTGYVVGVDLGVNYILTLLTNLQGTIISEHRESLTELNAHIVIPLLTKSIDIVVAQAPKSPYGIIGIGIGVPGMVDSNGTILLAPNLGWANIDIRKAVQVYYPQIPIFVENEANAGAIGEKEYGIGKHVSNLIYVSIGIGIGTGIILNNEVFRGTAGFSGETGHMTIDVNGKLCRCGNRGCWELYASEQALFRAITSTLPTKVEDSLESYIALAETGNASIIEIFEEIGHYLGIGIANIMNIFNPDLIIIGTRISAAERWLTASLFNCVAQRALQFQKQSATIQFSSLNTHSTALGVSFLAVSAFLKKLTSPKTNQG